MLFYHGFASPPQFCKALQPELQTLLPIAWDYAFHLFLALLHFLPNSHLLQEVGGKQMGFQQQQVEPPKYLPENHKVGFQTEMKQSQYDIISSKFPTLYVKYTYFVVICESFH